MITRRLGVATGLAAAVTVSVAGGFALLSSCGASPPPDTPDPPTDERERTPPEIGEPDEKKKPAPDPPAARERVEERAAMVETQIAAPRDLRTRITDERVLEAMRAAPRHAFVPERVRGEAYRDSPLPIGHGQTISQPYIVARMTELLRLEPGKKVLEIGTGSGYQAAVLAHLTPEVYSIEIVEPLHERADRTLREQQYGIECKLGDGYYGWSEHAPFDAIIVTCAAGHVPPPLWEQLAPGGRMVVPIGGPMSVQRLVVLTKQPDGTRRSKTITPVRFVPMTGRVRE